MRGPTGLSLDSNRVASHSTLSALVHNQPVSVLASPLLEKNGTPAWRHHEVSTETPLREGHNQHIGCPHFFAGSRSSLLISVRAIVVLARLLGSALAHLSPVNWKCFPTKTNSYATSTNDIGAHLGAMVTDYLLLCAKGLDHACSRN